LDPVIGREGPERD